MYTILGLKHELNSGIQWIDDGSGIERASHHRRVTLHRGTSHPKRVRYVTLTLDVPDERPRQMGIKGLTALLSQHAPNAIKEHDIKTLFGRKVAIDASMSIYQFLIAVRQKDGEMLQNDAGETTSHLMGFFYRTIRIVENGIKPAYVFDGKPPEMKKGVVSCSAPLTCLGSSFITRRAAAVKTF